MSADAPSPARIREQLGHPIVDGDGHFLEVGPVFRDHLYEVAGPALAERIEKLPGTAMAGISGGQAPPAELRRSIRPMCMPWWVATAETRDWATATAPALLYERLPELGLDFVVLYPTYSFGFFHNPDTEVRQVGCRTFNEYVAELFKPHRDRLEPAAMIPMHTPEEAVAELEHAAELGLKVALISGYVPRPLPALVERAPELALLAPWLDAYGVDSAHDYDPVWARCVELGMPVATHSHAMGWPDRSSITNYMFNHMGHFAAAGDLLVKSLFLGGVTKRFPKLRVGALEGGVTSGCRLFADLLARWEKRGRPAIDRLDPSRLDVEQALALLDAHGDARLRGHLDALRETLGRPRPVDDELLDCFAALDIQRPEDIRDLFVDSFFFGCEADDPLNAWAFRDDLNPLGAKLRAFIGSDIGHWDVVDFREPVVETWEMLDRGIFSAEDLRAFAFENPVAFYAGANADFFRGTALESETS